MDAKKTAFLGLGVMGFPMAGHLAKAGHAVTVYNRSAGKAAQWVEKHGGKSGSWMAGAMSAVRDEYCGANPNHDAPRDAEGVDRQRPGRRSGGRC